VLSARARPRPPSGAAGRAARALAMARRRLELRPPGNRAALVVPRIVRPSVGTVRVLARYRGPAAREAALRTAELFLEHRLFRSLHTGQVIRRDWLTCTTPRSGTTPSSRRCSCSPGRGLPMTGAAATPSSCWNAADGRTAAGSQAALAETARYATRHGGGRRPGPIRAQRDDRAQRAADTRDRTAISESEEPGILKSSISIPATAARPGHATG
jgi:hypothetical protein